MKTLQQINLQLDSIDRNHFDIVNNILTRNGWRAYDPTTDHDKSEEFLSCQKAEYKIYFAQQTYFKFGGL